MVVDRMVNGRALRPVRRRAIRSSEAIRLERLRRTQQLRKTVRPKTKRAQRSIRQGTSNLNRVFDPMAR